MKEKLIELIKKYKHGWAFSYFLIYIPWFRYLERTVTTSYHVMYSVIDSYIPFNEYFIVPYYFWFIYMTATLVYLFLKDAGEFYRYILFLAAGMSFCLFVCQIYPNGTDFRPVVDESKNWATKLVAFIHKVDTNTNVFPSIHVYNSIGTHIAICKSKYLSPIKYMKAFSLISLLSISASTVFLKQHSIIDVIGAIIIGYIAYILIYSKVGVPVSESENAIIR
jgi:hypothetical protein